MKRSAWLTLLIAGAAAASFAAPVTADDGAEAEPAERFVVRTIPIVIDSKDKPLAAWQVYITAEGGTFRVTGMASSFPAYAETPLYDRQSERGENDRLIVANVTLAEPGELPTGPTQVATVTVMTKGDPEFKIKLIVATDHEARHIERAEVLPVTDDEGD